MGLLDFIGMGGGKPAAGDAGATESVRRIVRELEAMPRERARFVAAFAYVLARVAHADLDISEAEIARMEQIVREQAGLPEAQAVLVVEIARAQNRLFGGTENYVVTREFREVSTPEERSHLLDCLFAVSAADDSISSAEEATIRLIAGELGFSHREFVDARAAWSDKRSVRRTGSDPRG